MLDGKIWNHLNVCKQMSNIELNYLSYIGILETIQVCANKWTLTIRLKIKLPTNYLFASHMYKNKIWH